MTPNPLSILNLGLTSVVVGLLLWLIIVIDTKSEADLKRDETLKVILSNQSKLDYIQEMVSQHTYGECYLP